MKSLYFIFVSLACYSVCLAESAKERFLRLNISEIDQLAVYASGNIFGPGEGGYRGSMRNEFRIREITLVSSKDGKALEKVTMRRVAHVDIESQTVVLGNLKIEILIDEFL